MVTTATITNYIIMFVLITVLFLIVANLYPTASAAGNQLNASGVPLGSLFTSGGVIWLVIMAAILLGVVIGALALIKHK